MAHGVYIETLTIPGRRD